jgi:hypothetical protein
MAGDSVGLMEALGIDRGRFSGGSDRRQEFPPRNGFGLPLLIKGEKKQIVQSLKKAKTLFGNRKDKELE